MTPPPTDPLITDSQALDIINAALTKARGIGVPTGKIIGFVIQFEDHDFVLPTPTRVPKIRPTRVLDPYSNDTPVNGTPAIDSACASDILLTLQEAGHRLTTIQLQAEMEAHNRLHGESTIRGWLARMVSDGRLTNNPQARPKGYGLPAWG